MLNAQEIQGQWNRIKGQVKEKWGQLSDNDLQIDNGNIDQLIGRIQQKTGEAREAIEGFLGRLADRGSAAADGLGSRLKDVQGRVSEWAGDGLDSATDFVRHRPGTSMAGVFGLGLVVGLLVGVAIRSR
jgi:uncharacterized protein YjbJ (UPF0337 family)